MEPGWAPSAIAESEALSLSLKRSRQLGYASSDLRVLRSSSQREPDRLVDGLVKGHVLVPSGHPHPDQCRHVGSEANASSSSSSRRRLHAPSRPKPARHVGSRPMSAASRRAARIARGPRPRPGAGTRRCRLRRCRGPRRCTGRSARFDQAGHVVQERQVAQQRERPPSRRCQPQGRRDDTIDPVRSAIGQTGGGVGERRREPLEITHGHGGRRHDARVDRGGMTGEQAGHQRLGELVPERAVDGCLGGGLHGPPPREPLRVTRSSASRPGRVEPGVSVHTMEFAHHMSGIDPLPPGVDRHHASALGRRPSDVLGQRPWRATAHPTAPRSRRTEARSGRSHRRRRSSPPDPAARARIGQDRPTQPLAQLEEPGGVPVAPPPAMMTPAARPKGPTARRRAAGRSRASGPVPAGSAPGSADERIPKGQVEVDRDPGQAVRPTPRPRPARPAVATRPAGRLRAHQVRRPIGSPWRTGRSGRSSAARPRDGARAGGRPCTR